MRNKIFADSQTIPYVIAIRWSKFFNNTVNPKNLDNFPLGYMVYCFYGCHKWVDAYKQLSD